MNIRSIILSKPMLALVAGSLTVPAFAPFGIWPLQIISLALLFHLALRADTIRQSTLLGWAYGYGWSVFGVYWLYITMHHYGHLPAILSAAAVALLAVFLGGFAALAFGIAAKLRQRWGSSDLVMALLILPATWALSEWMRGWLLTGLPWVVSGYAHNASPLAGFAPIVGVYGIGWISAVVAGSLALLPRHKLPLLTAGVILTAGAALHTVTWTTPKGQPIMVRLLQGNVSQESKFDRDRLSDSLTLYEQMITAAPADLIATPETALPLFIHQLPDDYLPRLAAYAQRTHSTIALGLLVSDGPLQYANSLVSISPELPANLGRYKLSRYDKHHLVPFGEFVPGGLHWFVDALGIPMADQTRGAPLQAPFRVKDQWVLPNICYEDLFGEEIANQLADRHAKGLPQAGILLNVSNLAWFDDSSALPQHLQIAQMRALETGRPMLRATNTGASAVVGPKGQVLALLPFHTRAALSATVQGMSGNTPYILFGNAIMIGFAALGLLSAWLFRKKHAQTDKTR
jgi:apolipoprotein N-acyltransferase